MDESRVLRSVLLDFYGRLLTDRQRACCELYYNEDLSLSEIAEQCGISRQGVWDNIRRADAALEEFEEKTGLVRRFARQRQTLERLREKARTLCGLTQGPAGDLARQIAEEVEALTEG